MIVICESYKPMAASISGFLERAGKRYLCCKDFKELETAVKTGKLKNDFALILDLDFFPFGGIEALKMLKMEFPTINVVLTGADGVGNINEVAAMGYEFVDFFCKPYSIPEMLHSIDMHQHKMEQEVQDITLEESSIDALAWRGQSLVRGSR